MNRDRKKQKKPFELQDFYFYPDDEENDTVDAIYGATAKAMTEKKVFPSWALFAYKDIIKNADKSTPPEELYYITGDAVILAPKIIDSSVKGLLIAKQSASNAVATMISGTGKMIRLRMPELPKGEVNLVENCWLDIVEIIR